MHYCVCLHCVYSSFLSPSTTKTCFAITLLVRFTTNASPPLLEEIPSSVREFEQVARWCSWMIGPTCRLLRDPLNLHELNQYKHALAIWRDNGTLTYVSPCGNDDFPSLDQQFLTLNFRNTGLVLDTVGATDDAIAETAAYFLRLEEPIEDNGSFTDEDDDDDSEDESSVEQASSEYETVELLKISTHGRVIDFSAAPSPCLIRIFEAAPSREVQFHDMILSAEHRIVQRSRSRIVGSTMEALPLLLLSSVANRRLGLCCFEGDQRSMRTTCAIY